MSTSFAALLFRPEHLSDRALSQGFAVALGGYDAPAPHLQVAPLRGLPGWWVAFYCSGLKLTPITQDDEFEHACELFEDDLPPAVAALDAAAEQGHASAVVYALTYAEGFLHDDAWRFAAERDARHFVRETDEGIEAGVETATESEVISLPDDRAAEERRGSTFLAGELGAPVLGPLMGALFAPERRVDVCLVEASPEAITSEVTRLNGVLRRKDGRGAFQPPSIRGVAAPPTYDAFVKAYDWADPSDPSDLYRELAIGAIEGTLHFMREPALRALDASWTGAGAGLYPIATLQSSALGGAREIGTIALADAQRLVLVKPDGRTCAAGPTFGELLRYVALGWKQRSDAEEDMIGALMLRARLRLT
jgi:hypothetical protein